jgi:predicted CopG family antitoxin
MPKPNQKTITITKDTYKIAEKKAKKEKKSVAGFVSDLILEKSVEA